MSGSGDEDAARLAECCGAVDLLERSELGGALEREIERLRMCGLSTEEAMAVVLAFAAAFVHGRFGGVLSIRSTSAAGRAVSRSLRALAARIGG